MQTTHTTASIAAAVDGDLQGPGDLAIGGLDDMAGAQRGQLTFIGSDKYAQRWADCQASAALVSRGIALEPGEGRALIVVDDADLAMARVLALFQPPVAVPAQGIHETAVIDPTARLGKNVRIGPHCHVGPGASIGDETILHAHITVMAQASVGSGCVLYPGVVIRERCILGDRCILHPNASIGADGFGYRPEMTEQGPRLVKIPQIGIVRLGHDVEIGANTCIDRAKFSQTVIGDGTKIDNLVQIAHNCRIGRMCVIAGCVAMAGSVTVGDGVVIGGGCQIADHLTIHDRATLAGSTHLMNDVPAGETWAGIPGRPYKQAAREYAAIRRLPDLVKQAKRR